MCVTIIGSMFFVLPVWCVLEGSGKWPENHDAVQRVKAAFHITLGQSLSNQLKLTNCVYPTHVDVLKVWVKKCQLCMETSCQSDINNYNTVLYMSRLNCTAFTVLYSTAFIKKKKC